MSRNPVLGYVECPKCQNDMEVKKTSKGSKRTPKKLGYCQHCRHMIQGNADQDYLAAMRPAGVVAESVVQPVAEPAEFEDFDPNELRPPVEPGQPVEPVKPVVKTSGDRRRVGWLPVVLGLVGAVVLGAGAVSAMSEGS